MFPGVEIGVGGSSPLNATDALSRAVVDEVARFEASSMLQSAIKVNHWLRFLPEHLGIQQRDARRLAFFTATRLRLEAIKNDPAGPESHFLRSLVGAGADNAAETVVLDLWLRYAGVSDVAARRCMRYMARGFARLAEDHSQSLSQEDWVPPQTIGWHTADHMGSLIADFKPSLHRMIRKDYRLLRRDWGPFASRLRCRLNDYLREERSDNAVARHWSGRNRPFELFACSQVADRSFCLGGGVCWTSALRIHALQMHHPDATDAYILWRLRAAVKGESQQERPDSTWVFTQRDRYLQACYSTERLGLARTRPSKDGRGPLLSPAQDVDSDRHLPETLQRILGLGMGRQRIAAKAPRNRSLWNPTRACVRFLRKKLREGVFDRTSGSTLVYYNFVGEGAHAFQVRLDRIRGRWSFFDSEQGMYSYPGEERFFMELSAYLSHHLSDIAEIGIHEIFLAKKQS